MKLSYGKIRLIDGFNSLTKQQIFDISAKHVLGNGKPGINLSGSCVYGGIGCAAAPFIAKEDREDASGTWYTVAKLAGEYHEQDFIRELQSNHDGAYTFTYNNPADFIEDFKKRMRLTAAQFRLSEEVLDKN